MSPALIVCNAEPRLNVTPRARMWPVTVGSWYTSKNEVQREGGREERGVGGGGGTLGEGVCCHSIKLASVIMGCLCTAKHQPL